MICLINAQRRKVKAREVKSSRPLTRSATNHSRDMIRRLYFAHEGPGGPALRARIRGVGYRFDASENVAFGVGPPATPAGVVAAWLASPPHKANMLNKRNRVVGLGVVAGNPIVPAQRRSDLHREFRGQVRSDPRHRATKSLALGAKTEPGEEEGKGKAARPAPDDKARRRFAAPPARATGLEPATSGVTGRRSNQLSYARWGHAG